MPVADNAAVDHDRADKNAKAKSSGKAKDLSHVPCKFFRVGSCTAGSSCPFSHSNAEPGQPKDVCAWFVKGNCKFGHKCALAHILPGQPMAMDRKNKKAAQMANASAKATSGAKRNGAQGGGGGGKGLLSGSTAPTRARPPMPPLKAAISPSAPAPSLKDTDFASFADVVSEDAKLPAAPAARKSVEESPTDDKHTEPAENSAPAPHPPSPPPPVDLSPIGSPPKHSPSTSPLKPSSPPFSAPSAQSIFKHPQPRPAPLGGVAMSLGAWGTLNGDDAVEDDDLEEFIPGSLSDLLTPEERSRRMSRTASSHLTHQSTTPHPAPPPSHRHSRSVPAASLLSDLKSIWSPDAPSSPSYTHLASPSHLAPHLPGLGNGSPSSFASASHGFGGRDLSIPHSYSSRGGLDDPSSYGLSLSPSNASAAFLPGLHHHYKSHSKPPTLHPTHAPSLYPPPQSASASADTFSVPSEPPRFSHLPSDPYLAPSTLSVSHTHNGLGAAGAGSEAAFSPSARALQAHAPGQSLPQGLAAGYSRMHARPPLASGLSGSNLSSGLSGVGSLGAGGVGSLSSTGAGAGMVTGVSPGATARDVLDSMMSRLSVSAYPRAGGMNGGAGAGVGAGVGTAGSSAQRSVPAKGPLSPLSGPVLTGETLDDDDLFSMDG
ncbi:hypothetical protein OE88DRAFT_1666972 [Heliocybe sulcata]|uniref:C3H1-type domain-containing protein n=1 Tax=Heliocybe sulcata TaxID=5364 RepID=A0A5C3MPP5_9AGAM|nr:hypothetical protein OE88DRAFT_1666972 [Heliocybe sulcata]